MYVLIIRICKVTNYVKDVVEKKVKSICPQNVVGWKFKENVNSQIQVPQNCT